MNYENWRPAVIRSVLSWRQKDYRVPVELKACILLWMVLLGVARAEPVSEYQVKALFLFNFTQFVEWPPTSLPTQGDPFLICILGEDPFGSYLDDAIRGGEISGHPLLLKRYVTADNVGGCHVLFVSRSGLDRLDDIMSKLKGRSTLTVGETPGFMKSGGMIRFLTINNKIRLHINPGAARAVELNISSKLLRHSEVVGDNG
jgi:hypothetical protein